MDAQQPFNDSITIVGAPSIPGLRFRHFRGATDFPHMVAVIAASAEIDHLERADTIEDIANQYAHLSNCDPYQDMLFAEVHGEVIGYMRSWWAEEANKGPYLYGFWGFLTPAWRRQGIGSAMLRWVETRLRMVAAAHPADRPQFFQSFVTQHQTSLVALLEDAGYQPVRYFYHMVRPTLDDIPPFSLPVGLEVRAVLPEHYRPIWEADIEALYDHWGFTIPTEEEHTAWLNTPILFQSHLWQVAWDTTIHQVAGQVRTFINAAENEKYNRRRGYTEFISVGRPWRRRGLARALIARSLHAQKAAGMTESILSVDSENITGATRLYEACGFQVVRRDTVYRKPL